MTAGVPLHAILVVSALLFTIGLFGALTRKNTLFVLVSIEIMINAANLNLVAFWRYGGDLSSTVLAFFGAILAGAESCVGLALVIALYRHMRSIDVDKLRSLSG
jgi:NADH-quinone oxidoreductase subunit K